MPTHRSRPVARQIAAAAMLITTGGVVAFASTTSSTPTQVAAPVVVDKVVAIVIENKGYTQTLNGAPYIKSLSVKYSNATAMKAITHPSQPNYYAMSTGSTWGLSNSYKKLTAPSVFKGAVASGRTAKVYQESMGSDNCRQSATYNKWARKHDPQTLLVNERALCEQINVGFKHFATDVAAGTLPNVGFVTPNMCNDAHDCSLKTADAWIKKQMALVFAGPDWQSGRLAVFITADEDDHNEGNRIIGIMVHPGLHGKVVGTSLNLYSLSKLFSEVGHSTPLLKALSAPSMSAAFGLTVGSVTPTPAPTTPTPTPLPTVAAPTTPVPLASEVAPCVTLTP